MNFKRIISILLALTMILSVMMSAVSCSSFTTLDDDDDEREDRTTNEKTEENLLGFFINSKLRLSEGRGCLHTMPSEATKRNLTQKSPC